jgi:hypothetical protein
MNLLIPGAERTLCELHPGHRGFIEYHILSPSYRAIPDMGVYLYATLNGLSREKSYAFLGFGD